MTIFSAMVEETNLIINQLVDLTNANCVLDYWARKDADYVNPIAPCMGFIDCVYHGPQIGDRHYGGETLCPECGDEMI